MLLLLGQTTPLDAETPIRERIVMGHDLLIGVTGVDLGFEPAAWHRHLRSLRGSDYRLTDAGFERQLREARSDPSWVEAIDSLSGRPPG
jgi:hypothetical protein